MKIRIGQTGAKSGSHDLANVVPHGLRDVLPRACLPAGEVLVTGQGVEPIRPDPSYSAAAFVNEWIGPGPKPALIPRDFTFKRVIGEPSW